MRREIFEFEHEQYRETVREFLARYGGGMSGDFRYDAIVAEESARESSGGPAFALQNDILAPYLLGLTNDEQKARWLPGFARGELVAAVVATAS